MKRFRIVRTRLAFSGRSSVFSIGVAMACLAVWVSFADAAQWPDATAEALDPGGPSFAWPETGAWEQRPEPVGPPLLRYHGMTEAQLRADGWRVGTWSPRDQPLGNPIAGVAEGAGRDGGPALRLVMTPDANRVSSVRWTRYIPWREPGNLAISGWVKAGPAPGSDGGFFQITVQMRDEAGDLVVPRGASVSRQMAVPGEWTRFEEHITIREGTARIPISFTKRGPGEVYLDDIEVRRTSKDEEVRLLIHTTGALDGTFAVGAGDFTLGRIAVKNEGQRPLRRARIEFEIPEGVELIGLERATAEGIRREDAGGGRVRWSQPCDTVSNPPGANRLRSGGFFQGQPFFFALRANIDPRREPYEARLRIAADGYEGPWRDFNLLVLPRVEPVTPPRRVHLLGNVPSFLEGDAATDYLAAYHRWGNSAAAVDHRNLADDLFSEMRRRDLFYYNNDWFLRDGFRVARGEWTRQLPDDARWVGPRAHGWAVCPEYIAQGKMTGIFMPYLRETFVQSGVYGAWISNWEVGLFDRGGCFCERCRKGFAAFSGRDEQDVLDTPEGDIVEKYGLQWRDYRRDVNHRCMVYVTGLMNRVAQEAGRPIPAYLWDGPASILHGSREPREVDRHRFLSVSNTAAAWTYRGVNFSDGVLDSPNHRDVGEQAEALMARLEEFMPDGFSYVHATLGAFGTLVTTPEGTQLDILSSALARPTAIWPWAYNTAYDYRYITAFANAARIISHHEDTIWDGERSVEVDIEAVGGGEVWARRFTRDGHTLFALFNFDWEKPVFFRLRAEIPAGFVLHDPVARLFYTSDQNGPELTDADRGGGAMLHLGALRSAFLVLEPAARANIGEGYRRVDLRRIGAAAAAR